MRLCAGCASTAPGDWRARRSRSGRGRSPTTRSEDDIRLLADHFLEALAESEGKKALAFTPDMIRVLEHYSWPGNARELRNEVHRLVLCAEPGSRIDVSMLPAHFAMEPSDTLGRAPPAQGNRP